MVLRRDNIVKSVEDVEVDEELVEASAKKEAKKTDEESDDEAEVEVDDEESEVEDEDEDDDDEDEKSESYSKKKKMAKEDVDMPSTKAGIIKAIYEKMSEMSKDDLTTAYNKVISEDAEESEEVVESAESIVMELYLKYF